MRLTFLGAAREVTGSMHVLETSRGRILVDCGLYQGRRAEARERNRRLPDAAIGAGAMILTHAHIDHSGSIPTLVKAGFEGTIYCTPATRDLCSYLLRDSARIQEGDATYLNRKFADDPDWEPIEPLYTEDDAVHALEHFVGVPYGRGFQPLAGVNARFADAGHILGSAQVYLETHEKGRARRLLFSGDLGRRGLPILRDPAPVKPPVDYALLESTYGNRAHEDTGAMHGQLEGVVKDTIRRGGKIIIPAFSVGRTQELLYALHELKRAGRLPAIPVFVDSPLSINVTEVFRMHPECYDRETRALLDQEGSVFDFDGIRFTRTREESMRLNALREPAVIVASSGMCEAGRVLHHLRNNVEDERNTIAIVGFQAQHTLGRRLVERRPKVRILGVERELRARVVTLNAFSAHADRDDLAAFASSCGRPEGLFLVHGEPEQQEPLRATLAAQGLHVTVPARGDVVELD